MQGNSVIKKKKPLKIIKIKAQKRLQPVIYCYTTKDLFLKNTYDNIIKVKVKNKVKEFHNFYHTFIYIYIYIYRFKFLLYNDPFFSI